MKENDFVRLFTEEGHILHQEGISAVPWNCYPRPLLKRDSFFCLNGAWRFRENNKAEETILVPFPPESMLSHIGRRMGKKPRLTYSRSFTLPQGFLKDRLLLHFGAVDQIAEVILDGTVLGIHRGGYDSFSFDITEFLKRTGEGESHTLTVHVTDELHTKILPYGKQREKRGGMWYTPVTGIWQTVWLESVPEEYVRSLHTDISVSDGKATVSLTAEGVSEGKITVALPEGEQTVLLTSGKAEFVLENPRMWSPEDPWLYRYTLQTEADKVQSYFAVRTLEIKTANGVPRLCLNGKPYFFHGLLDQGYWSDGLFTPASPKLFEKEILQVKSLGFNTLRKHIKVEAAQFYYDCDRLGMIVFQDMVNNGRYSFLRDTALPTIGMKRLPDRLLPPHKPTQKAFLEGMERTVRPLLEHPSVCCWTIFNEGWGQFDGNSMYRRLKAMDNTRFIDTASGWFKVPQSDVESPHVYFKPVRIKPSAKPILLSEFGGYSFKPQGHAYNPKKTYGYRFFDNRKEYENALEELYLREIVPAAEKGLCGAIYTQVSDIEDETNGLFSYDRRVLKVDATRMKRIAALLTGDE